MYRYKIGVVLGACFYIHDQLMNIAQVIRHERHAGSGYRSKLVPSYKSRTSKLVSFYISTFWRAPIWYLNRLHYCVLTKELRLAFLDLFVHKESSSRLSNFGAAVNQSVIGTSRHHNHYVLYLFRGRPIQLNPDRYCK